MPIKLHIDTAGPLDHGILADGIIERTHEYIGAVGLSNSDRCVRGFVTRCRSARARTDSGTGVESENRHSRGRQHQRTADTVLLGVSVTVKTPLFCGGASECRHETGYEAVETAARRRHEQCRTGARQDFRKCRVRGSSSDEEAAASRTEMYVFASVSPSNAQQKHRTRR